MLRCYAVREPFDECTGDELDLDLRKQQLGEKSATFNDVRFDTDGITVPINDDCRRSKQIAHKYTHIWKSQVFRYSHKSQ